MSDERRALRELGEWRPQAILRRLGPAPGRAHYLPHLILALAILHGPERVNALVKRLEVEGRRVVPRLDSLAELDPIFPEVALQLRDLLQQLAPPRARAANETKEGGPGGMIAGDLRYLAELIRVVVASMELTKRPTAAGIARTKRFFDIAPPVLDALAWCGKLGTPASGVTANLAAQGGRTVVIFRDGKLAYDPAME